MKQKSGNVKKIKKTGTLIFITGIIFILLIPLGIFSSDSTAQTYYQESLFYRFVNENFPLLLISGLIFLLIGIIIRSIGKSKEAKFSLSDDRK